MVCDISERFKMKTWLVFSLGQAQSLPVNRVESQDWKGFDASDTGAPQQQNTLAAL
jgi:hypothetical protein